MYLGELIMNKKVFGVYIELIGYRVCELLLKE